MALFNEEWQLIKSIDPVTDAFAVTPTVEVIDMAEFSELAWIMYVGVGTTGTSIVTMEAVDDTSASNQTAVTFFYREITSGDTEGTLTAATTSGFTTTAGSSKIVSGSVPESVFGASGYRYARVKLVESANAAVLGSLMLLGRKKVQRDAPAVSAID